MWYSERIKYCFINNRPCDNEKKMTELFNRIYQKYNNKGRYCFIVHLILDESTIDFNVTPDKRSVYMKDTKLIFQKLENEL